MLDPDLQGNILKHIPHEAPFLFIDQLLEVDDQHIVGTYTFRVDEFFYQGHFPGNPVTPGAILTETMAQVGLVAFGIYLLKDEIEQKEYEKTKIYFTSSQVDFHQVVLPEEKVIVYSYKQYFRFKKLKCEVKMTKEDGSLVASGVLAGMFQIEK